MPVEDFIHEIYLQIAKGRAQAGRPCEPYAEWRADVQRKADVAQAAAMGRR